MKELANIRDIYGKVAIILIGAMLFVFSFGQDTYASTSILRLSGSDRYLTAIAVSQSGWPDGAENVVIATGQNFPDALSAAPLAGKYNAPILLAGPNGLSSETIKEIKRLNPKKAYIVGGSGAVPSSVERQLSTNGVSLTRLSGKDRYETAMTVARSVGFNKGIFVVPGGSFADALSAAPIAATEGMPIIPVPSNDLTKSQKNYFARAKLSRVVIVGSQSEIPSQIRNQFTAAENIAGNDPYARNIALLEHFSETINTGNIFVATGKTYPDALAAAAYAQLDKNPVILLNGNQVSSSVEKYFSSRVINNVTVLGGEGVLPSSLAKQLASLIPTITEVKDLHVVVKANQAYSLPLSVEAKTSKGNWVQVPVTWNLTDVSTAEAGTYYYSGTVSGYEGTVELELTVEAAPVKADTISAEVICGSKYSLPETVTVTMSDNTTKEVPVKWSTTPNVSILNKIGTYTFQGTIDGTNLTTSLNLKVSEDEAIEFKDGSLEWAVKYALGKQSSTQPAYLSEVLKLTTLDLKGYGIRDLTGMERFTNLRSLDLQNNFLEGADLSALQKLSNLRSLNLRNNELEQITALKNLTQLTYLDVSVNKIDDFTPIRDLIRLTSLFLDSNETQDYSPATLYYHRLIDKDFTL